MNKERFNTLGELGRRFGCEKELGNWLSEHVFNYSVSQATNASYRVEAIEEIKQFTERELKRELLRNLPFEVRWENDVCTITLSVLK